jgi:hypothetical protein
MTDSMNNNVPKFEVELQMPQFVEGSIESENGTVLSIGDKVSHDELGLGTVARLLLSHEHGFLAHIRFDSGDEEIIGVNFLEKVNA